jgi:hypothetical protein
MSDVRKRNCPACHKLFKSPYKEAVCGTCSTNIINAIRYALRMDPLPNTHESKVANAAYHDSTQLVGYWQSGMTDGNRIVVGEKRRNL